jgi:deoxyribonuclease IV
VDAAGLSVRVGRAVGSNTGSRLAVDAGGAPRGVDVQQVAPAGAGVPRVKDWLGAHMSIAGGLHLALHRGREIGCSVVQIFLKNQRQWRAKELTAVDVSLWRHARRMTAMRATFAHATYLINLAAPHDSEWVNAIGAFHGELERAEALGLPFVVIHAGSHRGAGLPAGTARVGRALDELVTRTAGYGVRIVLENSAGGGHTLGRSPAELAAILDRAARPERLGICLDTCHLFAAGYDLRTREGYQRAIEECQMTIGLASIVAFHLNDSRASLGSRRDCHEHIGRGQLGLAPFRWLLNDPRFASVPKVLETPKDPEPIMDRRNLATLRRLVTRPAQRRSGVAAPRPSGPAARRPSGATAPPSPASQPKRIRTS